LDLAITKYYDQAATSQYRVYMQPTAKDRVAWSVGVSVRVVSPAKTAEPIETLFAFRTLVV